MTSCIDAGGGICYKVVIKITYLNRSEDLFSCFFLPPLCCKTASVAATRGVSFEALDFGSGSRNMNLARETIEFYRTNGRDWPLSQVLHLIAVFNGGCPWKREYWLARGEQIPKILYWAFDQVCIFSWEPGVPTRGDRTQNI